MSLNTDVFEIIDPTPARPGPAATAQLGPLGRGRDGEANRPPACSYESGTKA